MLVGDFNVEPTKIPVWQKGFRLGSGWIWKLLRPYLQACTRCGVRRLAVDEFAHPQQAPLELHEETWAGLCEEPEPGGGPLPGRGLVLGRGSALFRVVRLGGPKVLKARGNAADAHDAADVFLYRDSSIALLLDMRRRSKAVMDVLGAMVQYAVSLARSVELTAQWDRILAVGPLFPVTLDDLHAVEGSGLGDFHRVVCGVHHRLSDFIHGVLVRRRDEAIRGWRNWLREDPWCTRISGFGPIWFSLLPFFSVSPILHLVVLRSLLIRPKLMKLVNGTGILLVVIVGILWLVALLLLLFFPAGFSLIVGLLPILLFAPYLIVVGGLVLLLRLSSVPPLACFLVTCC